MVMDEYAVNALSIEVDKLRNEMIEKTDDFEERIKKLERRLEKTDDVNPLYHKISKLFYIIDQVNRVNIEYEESFVNIHVSLMPKKTVKFMDELKRLRELFREEYVELKKEKSSDQLAKGWNELLNVDKKNNSKLFMEVNDAFCKLQDAYPDLNFIIKINQRYDDYSAGKTVFLKEEVI